MKVAVVGCPNVGKSSLINRLAGTRETVVEETPGVTRDRKEIPVEWIGREFTLIDTGGVDAQDQGPFTSDIITQVEAALADAQLVVFVIDVKVGVRAEDERVVTLLRRTDLPVILAVNKCDSLKDTYETAEFYSIGFGEPYPVSAQQGLGTGDLLDEIVKQLPPEEAEDTLQSSAQIALIGRPNVGKSSLLNAMLGSERVIVSDISGTTRDSIDTELEFMGRQVTLIDTAGIRRQAKVSDQIEYYSTLRSKDAARRADVAIVVCDATDGVTTQDLKIADEAMHAKCATLLVLNKWDQTSGDEFDLQDEREFVWIKARQRPPLLVCSAKTGRGLDSVLATALQLSDYMSIKVPTPELNRFLAEVTSQQQPPSKHGGRLNMLYMTQIQVRPPRFSIFVNSRKRLTRSYVYYLENQLRETYDFEGVPLVIDFFDRE